MHQLAALCLFACASFAPPVAHAIDAPAQDPVPQKPAAPDPKDPAKAKFAGRKLGGKVGRGGGATQATEFALLKSMRWLMRHQSADGSWTIAGVAAACDPESHCQAAAAGTTANHDVGLTSLSLLVFLGAGYHSQSKQDLVDALRGARRNIGEIVGKAASWLVQHQREDGSFADSSSFLFDDACATLALVEVYGLTSEPAFAGPAQKAIDHLQLVQRSNPAGEGKWGWGFRARDKQAKAAATSDDDSELSASTWAALALRSACISRLNVDPNSLAGAFAFADASAKGTGPASPKRAADKSAAHPAFASAIDACLRLYSAPSAKDPFLGVARARMLADLPGSGSKADPIDYEYWHFAHMALWQLDGPDRTVRDAKTWDTWNKALVQALLAGQSDDKLHCQHGGWTAPDRSGAEGGALYATALNALTLESYYRYWPALEPAPTPAK